jgi:hypothetical protein
MASFGYPKYLAVALVAGLACLAYPHLASSSSSPPPGTVHHYEYVFPDGNLYVYDIDNNFSLVKHLNLPTGTGTRGAVASAATGILYVSYGSDNTTGGSMLAYDLGNDAVLWTRHYPFGIDSMSVSPDGSTIYMPTGELTNGGIWEVLNAANGKVIRTINSGGTGPHNTVVSLDGSKVFMGPRYSNYLVMAKTATDAVSGRFGPIKSGVRPFTINSNSTLAFITTSGFLGFSVADLSTGRMLATTPVHGFPATGGAASAPSHGISLSPDETQIYLIDSINSYVQVFDVSGLPASPPKQVADIALQGKISGNEHGCAYDCLKDGWLHHSHDGRYVFVGDSGDVIDTGLRRTVATLPAMINSRKEIEIDMQNGKVVWAMNNRSSIGMGSSPTPVAGMPQPPALHAPIQTVSLGQHTYGGRQYTVHGDGVQDETAAIQAAINAGDVDVLAGVYQVNGTLSVPSNRNILCETKSNPQSGTVAFQHLAATSGYHMFSLNGTNNASFYGCQFREVGYNTSGAPNCSNYLGGTIWLEPGSNNKIDVNDFNGVNGYNGAVALEQVSASQTNANNRISYNSFEHCGLRGVEIADGINNSINHNTSLDCGEGLEEWNSPPSQHMTGNVFDHETVKFVHGVGAGQGCPAGDNSGWYNNITGGASCHPGAGGSTCPYDYSGNTVQNSSCTSSGPQAFIAEHYSQSKPAHYSGNTTSGSCSVN